MWYAHHPFTDAWSEALVNAAGSSFREACVRIAIASSRAVLEAVATHDKNPHPCGGCDRSEFDCEALTFAAHGSLYAERAIRTATWWVRAPGRATRETAGTLVRGAPADVADNRDAPHAQTWKLNPARIAGMESDLPVIFSDMLHVGMDEVAGLIGAGATRAALARDVAPWALGEADPLR